MRPMEAIKTACTIDNAISEEMAFEVGVTGFEPATYCSRSNRATRLRHTPKIRGISLFDARVSYRFASWFVNLISHRSMADALWRRCVIFRAARRWLHGSRQI